MPVVLRHGPYRVFFYSDEGEPREPAHVRHGDAEAKIWLRPQLGVAYDLGFNAPALREVLRWVEFRRAQLERAWDAYFA